MEEHGNKGGGSETPQGRGARPDGRSGGDISKQSRSGGRKPASYAGRTAVPGAGRAARRPTPRALRPGPVCLPERPQRLRAARSRAPYRHGERWGRTEREPPGGGRRRARQRPPAPGAAGSHGEVRGLAGRPVPPPPDSRPGRGLFAGAERRAFLSCAARTWRRWSGEGRGASGSLALREGAAAGSGPASAGSGLSAPGTQGPLLPGWCLSAARCSPAAVAPDGDDKWNILITVIRLPPSLHAHTRSFWNKPLFPAGFSERFPELSLSGVFMSSLLLSAWLWEKDPPRTRVKNKTLKPRSVRALLPIRGE